MMEESSQINPNILWIGVDQMRADTLLNDFVKTPNLDRLRSQSTCFTRAYSPSSLCTPARGSMYTGLFAFKHGMGTNCDMYHALAREMPQPEQLLHTRLQAQGYRTGFTGKWHVGTKLGPADYGFEGMSIPGYGDLRDDQGFQRYLLENGLSYGPIRNPIYANHDQQTLMAGEWDGPVESTPPHFLANYSIELLEEFSRTYCEGGQPFFLTTQFWAPHGPYLPSPEYVGTHDRTAIPPWPNWQDDYHGKPDRYPRLVNSFFAKLPSTWQEWQELIGLAYDYTTQVDAEIGRLLTKLDELDLAENTVIIFESDHGDMLGSHGLNDKGYMYEEAHRVPLMVRLPGQQKPHTHDALVYNMDIFPTILDVTRVPHPDYVNGQKVIEGPGKSLTYAWNNPEAKTNHPTQYFEMTGFMGVYHEGWTLAGKPYRVPWSVDPSELAKFDPLNTEWELYNVDEDPTQSNDIAAQHPEKVKELEKIFMQEAEKYDVFPLGGSLGRMLQPESNPQAVAKKHWELTTNVYRVPELAGPEIKSTNYEVNAYITSDENTEGVIYAVGERMGGQALFIKDGKLRYSYSTLGLYWHDFDGNISIPKGEVKITLKHTMKEAVLNGPSTVELFINDNKVGSMDLKATVYGAYTAHETFDIGRDEGMAVNREYENNDKFIFTEGQLHKVVFDIE